MKRRNEKRYWQGLRDALVMGVPNPGLRQNGLGVAEDPYYCGGFRDGKKAVERISGRGK